MQNKNRVQGVPTPGLLPGCTPPATPMLGSRETTSVPSDLRVPFHGPVRLPRLGLRTTRGVHRRLNMNAKIHRIPRQSHTVRCPQVVEFLSLGYFDILEVRRFECLVNQACLPNRGSPSQLRVRLARCAVIGLKLARLLGHRILLWTPPRRSKIGVGSTSVRFDVSSE